jgi:hypothetical protein
MEVGLRLPQKQRADVQLELRSALQDALDERGLDADSDQDEAKVAALLMEWGKPSHVAEGYGARIHLIGPELQPIYWLVLRINVLVISIVHLVLLAIAAFNQGEFGPLIGNAIGNYVDSLLISFAVVTIIFAVLEHFLPELKALAAAEHKGALPEWDPRTLPGITPDRDKVDYVELIIEIIITGALITVINLAPGWQFSGDMAIVGELIAKFLPFIPWITILAVVEISLDIYLLTQGRWQLATRWVSFGHAAASAILITSTLQAAPFSAVDLVDSTVKLVIAIVLVITLIDAAIKLYRALRPGVPLPWENWRIEEDIEEMGEKAEQFGKAMETRFKKPDRK